jgi:hypothetical protein
VRRLLLVCALVMLTASGCFVVPDARAEDRRVFTPTPRTTATFDGDVIPQSEPVERDGVTLQTTVFRRPAPADRPDWTYPVIVVMGNGFDNPVSAQSPEAPGYYAYNDHCTEGQCLVGDFTRYGYAVVFASMRGSGRSGGCFDYWGPQDAADFRAVVRHYADADLGGWRTGRVGAWGGSAEAMVAVDGATADDGLPLPLSTMVLMSATSALRNTYEFDGVWYPSAPEAPLVYTAIMSAPSDPTYPMASAPEPVDPAADAGRVAGNAPCHARDVAAAVPGNSDSSFWSERDYVRGVGNVQASVLYVQGFTDTTVLPINIDGWYDELPGFKRAILGQLGHGLPWRDPATASYPWFETFHAWFDSELLGVDSSVHGWPAVQVQDEQLGWRTARSAAGIGADHDYVVGGDVARSFSESSSATIDLPDVTGPHLAGQIHLDVPVTISAAPANVALDVQEVDASGAVQRTLVRGYRAVTSPTDRLRIRTHYFDVTLQPGHHVQLVLRGAPRTGETDMAPTGSGYVATITGPGIVTIPSAVGTPLEIAR